MQILITGGAGFIGSHFSENLALGMYSSNYKKITILDKFTYAGNIKNLSHIKSKKLEIIKGDILNYKLVLNLVKQNDIIINFAAETHVDRSLISPRTFVDTNYVGVSNILSAVKKVGQKKFIQVSTDEVYGQITKGSWKENQALNPRSPYSATKAAADQLVMSYVTSFGIDACITRASNNFGPRQHPEKLIPKTIINILENKKVPIYGEGKNIRDWLYVEDHVLGIERVINSGRSGEIYHLGGDNEFANIEIVKMILEIMNVSVDQIDYVQDRPGHDFRYSISSTKSKLQLGYVSTNNFKSKLEDTIKWYTKNSLWWKKSGKKL